MVARAPVWLWPAAAFALIAPESAAAPPGADPNTPTVLAGLAPEQVYVWGLRQETIGMATSASEGQVNFAESNPIPCKAAMAAMGLLEENYRLPLVPPSAATREKVMAVLQQLKMLGAAARVV